MLARNLKNADIRISHSLTIRPGYNSNNATKPKTASTSASSIVDDSKRRAHCPKIYGTSLHAIFSAHLSVRPSNLKPADADPSSLERHLLGYRAVGFRRLEVPNFTEHERRKPVSLCSHAGMGHWMVAARLVSPKTKTGQVHDGSHTVGSVQAFV